ncbi:MAG TPA: FKBP-type peptidyl-prolyl cis-trans isomerase [Pyrinomonadaceae bacterium]|nr:FKBP-type peptidyl-prolyl cis-trans isomerase [Pyrinomonadaceae bacterium]
MSSAPASRKQFNLKVVVIVLIVAVAASAIAYVVANRRGQAGTEVTTPSGLKYTDLRVGEGATPRLGQTVRVHYIGWLEDGKEFNNSYKGGKPIDFQMGPGLIPGWNEALQTMKVGGKRRIVLPPNLAYGAKGSPPNIPPNATLTFEIELLGAQ